MQYYYAAKILLLLKKPNNQPLVGFNAAKDRRKAEVRESNLYLYIFV